MVFCTNRIKFNIYKSKGEICMFCPNCGKENSPFAKFCENCGAEIPDSPAPEQNAPQQQPQPMNFNEQPAQPMTPNDQVSLPSVISTSSPSFTNPGRSILNSISLISSVLSNRHHISEPVVYHTLQSLSPLGLKSFPDI